MAVIVIANIKGGSGKTTTAENLAVLAVHDGYSVAIIDADPAGDISEWAQDRMDNGYKPDVHCEQASGDDVMPLIDKLNVDHDLVIIDVGGADSDAMRYAVIKAHKLYIPIEPQDKSVKKLLPMNKMVNNARSVNPDLEAIVFVNRAPTNIKIKSTQEALEIASHAPDLKVSNVVIHERTIVKKASEEGMGVIEHPMIVRTSANVSTKREFTNFYQEVIS
jgi:chromosome partitioning protein